MTRLLLTFGLALHFALAGGVSTAAFEERCEQRCPDDGPDGKCAPTCVDCTCCVHVRLAELSAGLASPLPAVRTGVIAAPVVHPSSPEPGEILHVPIASLS